MTWDGRKQSTNVRVMDEAWVMKSHGQVDCDTFVNVPHTQLTHQPQRNKMIRIMRRREVRRSNWQEWVIIEPTHANLAYDTNHLHNNGKRQNSYIYTVRPNAKREKRKKGDVQSSIMWWMKDLDLWRLARGKTRWHLNECHCNYKPKPLNGFKQVNKLKWRRWTMRGLTTLAEELRQEVA